MHTRTHARTHARTHTHTHTQSYIGSSTQASSIYSHTKELHNTPNIEAKEAAYLGFGEVYSPLVCQITLVANQKLAHIR